MKFLRILAILLTSTIALGTTSANADDTNTHKVVIQVSTDDARTQKIALNNAANIYKL